MTANERKWWLRAIARDYFGLDINADYATLSYVELVYLHTLAKLCKHKRSNPNMSLAQDFLAYLQRGLQAPF